MFYLSVVMKNEKLLGEILNPAKSTEVFLWFSMKPFVFPIDIQGKQSLNFCRLYCYLFKME